MNSTEPLPTLSDKERPLPTYIRLPKKGRREFYTGLPLTTLYRLVMPSEENNFKPPVESKLIFIGPNQRSGSRLVNLRSLLDYIERQPEQLNKAAGKSGKARRLKLSHQPPRSEMTMEGTALFSEWRRSMNLGQHLQFYRGVLIAKKPNRKSYRC
jgi:hypothetical protein